MLKLLSLTVLLFGAALARKGGKKTKIDLSDVVNPDPDAAKFKDENELNADLIEGDIIGDSTNSEDRNAVSDKTKLWPKGYVPFVLDESLSDDMKSKISESMADFHKYTCLKFSKRSDQRDYVRFGSFIPGCNSHVGRVGRDQKINLEYPKCMKKGTIIHETLHAVGFWHEHNRPDRDDYIKIQWDNIPRELRFAYKKTSVEDTNTQGFPYDFSSVMHYNSFGRTIQTVDPANQRKLGQRAGFSKQDIEEVNKLYKCKNGESQVEGEIASGCLDEGYCHKIIVASGNQRLCSIAPVKKSCPKTCKLC